MRISPAPSPWRPLNQPQAFQRSVALPADDDVVVNRDAERLGDRR